jgi:WD40 repeat protein
MKHVTSVSILALSLSLAGCGASVAPSGDGGSIAPTRGAPRGCAPTQRQWWNAGPEHQIDGLSDSYFGISPNGGWVLHAPNYLSAPARYLRTSTGEEVFATAAAEGVVYARDAAWRREISATPEGALVVQTIVTRRVLFTLPAPAGASARWVASALSPDGGTVVAAACNTDGLVVSSFSVDSASALHSVSVAGGCPAPYDGVAQFASAPSASAETVLLAMPGTGLLNRIDLATGAVVSRRAHGPAMTSVWPWSAGLITALAVSPDGTRAVTTGVDGMLRVWSLPGLDEIAPAIPVRIGVANTNVYAPPRPVSPVAFSPDGALLAFVASDGEPEVRALADGRTVASLTRPVVAGSATADTADPVVHLAFARDGGLLAVGYERAAGLWACEGVTFPAPQDVLQVTIDGPSRLAPGATGSFVATHMGTEDVHSHQFFVDGAPVSQPSAEREVSFATMSAGTHRLSVVIDDGVDTGHATMDVLVAP